MEIKTENTAPESAMQTAANLIRYQTLLALVNGLFERGEINAETHDTACLVIARFCGLENTSIFI
jgi:hypothetical protein